MAQRRKSSCKYGVRKSGPKLKSGPRKGKYRCYKSKASASRARSMSRNRSPSPYLSMSPEQYSLYQQGTSCQNGVRISGPKVKVRAEKGFVPLLQKQG